VETLVSRRLRVLEFVVFLQHSTEDEACLSKGELLYWKEETNQDRGHNLKNADLRPMHIRGPPLNGKNSQEALRPSNRSG
jgi:hypothetical protein